MMQRTEKRGREEALDRWKADQRAAARAKFPMPDPQMRGLFNDLDAALGREQCDHTLRFVRQWVAEQSLSIDAVERWLNENGGNCDCTALVNSRQAWQDAIHDVNWG